MQGDDVVGAVIGALQRVGDGLVLRQGSAQAGQVVLGLLQGAVNISRRVLGDGTGLGSASGRQPIRDAGGRIDRAARLCARGGIRLHRGGAVRVDRGLAAGHRRRALLGGQDEAAAYLLQFCQAHDGDGRGGIHVVQLLAVAAA